MSVFNSKKAMDLCYTLRIKLEVSAKKISLSGTLLWKASVLSRQNSI